MNLTQKLLIFICLLISLQSYGQSESFIDKISQKWILDHYKYLIFSEDPSDKEKGDYIHLNKDMTFSSISEGVYDKGQWSINADQDKLILTSNNEEGQLLLIIDELSNSKLVLKLDDPTDADAKRLKIIFKKQ